MTVNIEGSARSIPESLDSLRTTPLVMHRVWFDLNSTDQWYAVMREARTMFGRQWRAQSRTRRKFERMFPGHEIVVKTWFEVPDPAFATWCAVKLGVNATPAK